MRDFSKAKRIVVKIGTNVLTKDGGVDAGYVRRVAGQISSLVGEGRQMLIVSSGAIGMGAGRLELEGGVKGQARFHKDKCHILGWLVGR